MTAVTRPSDFWKFRFISSANKKARHYCGGRPFQFWVDRSDHRPSHVGMMMVVMMPGDGSCHKTVV